MIGGLDYMKYTFKAMHRDIKPSNVLVGYDGTIKVGLDVLSMKTNNTGVG
jgi:serine/threonine protein kinase